MKQTLSIIVTALLFFMVGCNGSSGENDSGTKEPAVASSLILVLLNSQGQEQLSFDINETITLSANVLDQSGIALPGTRVNFNTDLGTLSSSSVLTDSSGIANITISNPNMDISAGTVTATVSQLSESKDYEFTSTVSPAEQIYLTAQLSQNGLVTNQFRTNESIQVTATLLDAQQQPINNEIITFSADVGELTPATAMTVNGTAGVSLQGNGSIGAGVITATLNSNTEIVFTMNYEVLAQDAVIDEQLRIGHFNNNNEFIEGEIELSIGSNTMSAGGTAGVSVDVVNSLEQPVTSPIAVTFTSECASNNYALLDATKFTIQGTASATFEDINCAGKNGISDQITAVISTNGVPHTATGTINISGEELGAIEFISASPSDIVIKGSGGQEASTLTFLVKSSIGNPLPQQLVNFTLDNSSGGLTLSRESGLTNSQGMISTQVLAGTTPTVARVTASSEMDVNGEMVNVQTQSNQLSVNTGLPDQASMTIAATVLNPEGDLLGNTSQIRAWLADSFNNPVPDGTTVNFTSEGGSIEPSCHTINGTCSVTWTATAALPSDHRATILMTASGHETFYDSNGNNIFDDGDGSAITNKWVSAGFSRQIPQSSGFVDMSEAWRDDDEDGEKDANEVIYFDNNQDGEFNAPDNKFNGPQCEGSTCNETTKKSTLRKAFVLIMASSYSPKFTLTDQSSTTTYATDQDTLVNDLPDVADGSSLNLTFNFADSAMQTLPLDSTVSVTIEGGELRGITSAKIGNNNRNTGYDNISFSIYNELGGDPEIATLTFTIKGPRSESSGISFTKNVNIN